MNQAASEENLPLVVELIRNAFVDHLNGSYDSKREVEELSEDLRKFMSKQGLPIKAIAITGEKPETAL